MKRVTMCPPPVPHPVPLFPCREVAPLVLGGRYDGVVDDERVHDAVAAFARRRGADEGRRARRQREVRLRTLVSKLVLKAT